MNAGQFMLMNTMPHFVKEGKEDKAGDSLLD